MASSATRRKVDPRSLGYRKCESQKVGYATRDEALSAAEGAMDAGKVSPGCHITPYLCARCDEWHLWNRPIVKDRAVRAHELHQR